VRRKQDETLKRHLLLDLGVFELVEAVVTLLSTHFSSADGERVARSLLRNLEDTSIGFFGWSSEQGLSVRAHLLCCARKADSLALSCSSTGAVTETGQHPEAGHFESNPLVRAMVRVL